MHMSGSMRAAWWMRSAGWAKSCRPARLPKADCAGCQAVTHLLLQVCLPTLQVQVGGGARQLSNELLWKGQACVEHGWQGAPVARPLAVLVVPAGKEMPAVEEGRNSGHAH